MELTTTKKILKEAQEGHYAIGAFNVENMEMVMAVISAAEEMNAPVIMQTTPSTVKYAGLDYFLANVRVAASKANVPVVMHLDHGSSFELASQAYRSGYTSIMIDGSHSDFESNIEISKSVKLPQALRLSDAVVDQKSGHPAPGHFCQGRQRD